MKLTLGSSKDEGKIIYREVLGCIEYRYCKYKKKNKPKHKEGAKGL